MSLMDKKLVRRSRGFTLIEVVTAVGILGFILSSSWLIIDRCVNASADMKLKMEALEVARENLETILTKVSVEETSEYGTSDEYPAIEWENVIETFYEPIGAQMWLRAICTAMYYDSNGKQQSVELVHWLTQLTKDQLLQILMRQDGSEEELAPQLIDSIEDAAIYTGVSADTVQKWLDNGMLTSEDGKFIKNNLDLFKLYNGNPNQTDKENMQVVSQEDLRRLKNKQNQLKLQDEVDQTTGLTYGQIEQMNIQEIWDILKKRQESGSLKD